MKIGLISNVNIHSLAKRAGQRHTVYSPDGYNTWIAETLDLTSGLYRSNAENVFILLSSRGDLDPQMAMEAITTFAERRKSTRVFVSTIEVMPCSTVLPIKKQNARYQQAMAWMQSLEELITKMHNVSPFDLNRVVMKYGEERIFSSKMWYLSSSPFSAFGERCLIEMMEDLLRFYERPQRKCLLLDLDNTLWGGVIGEDGVGGIDLSGNKEGARYSDFQRVALEMKKQGVLLGIVSKNNAEDAEEGFSHPDSVLQWEDFAIKRANWDPKSRNIVEMAKELNIGLDSIVFVDDNPIERAEVKSSLPEVEVPEFPEDTCQLACFGEDLYRRFFLKWDLSDEDKQKTEMYLENKAREESKTQFFSMEQYLSSLNMELFMEEAREEHLPRIQQMVLKTNQFNMTTRRYGEETLRGMIQSEKAHVLIGRMKDRFGDNGICVLLIVLIEGSQAHIDTFLMSCRVMGRTVEHAAVLWMEAFLRKKNVKTLTAEMIPTKKNMPARAFYKEMGYMQTSDSSETEKYRSSLEREKKVPCYVKIC